MHMICEELGTVVCYTTLPCLIAIGLFPINLRRCKKYDPTSRCTIIESLLTAGVRFEGSTIENRHLRFATHAHFTSAKSQASVSAARSFCQDKREFCKTPNYDAGQVKLSIVRLRESSDTL
jgi:hypothetical protein